jgi:streptogramin lyase
LGLLALTAGLAVAVPAGRAAATSYLNVWVHYDYMVAPDHSDAPNPVAIQMVVDAFKAHGVTLHIDPQHAAIPAHSVIVPDWPSEYASSPGFDSPSCTGPDAVLFSALKAQYFQPSSNHPWHYAIFGDYVFTNSLVDDVNCPKTHENGGHVPIPGMSGISQVGFLDAPGGLGYNFVVALQGLRDIHVDLNDPANARIEAALFMHELGHNLGLCHGGPNLPGTDCTQGNYKTNYISVMNYFFQFGIPVAATAGSTALVGWRVDYSDVQLPDLDQSCLNETVGLQDAAHPTDISRQYGGPSPLVPVLGPVDWNFDGNTTDTCLQHSLNPFNGAPVVLHGADDWAWLHSRLTPPAITNLSLSGADLSVSGVNLMAPATVIFSGGAEALGQVGFNYDMSPNTSLDVTVPVGAKSGPVTIVTPEGKAESSQSVTITSTAHGPEGIATGPDGNLWFTEPSGNAIGRITPTGTITEFPLPTPSSNPWRIAAGPDGNLWFTQPAADEVGRITPAGKITEYPLPSSPQAITAGPDGNLWITEPAPIANKIGRITPSGQLTEFPIPTQFSDPTGITAGPDGNLWFTEQDADTVGRITPAGTITEFPVPVCFEASGPGEITAGADGNLYFTGGHCANTNDDSAGRMTPTGAFTPLDPLTLGAGITAGPDGNTWFTEPSGSFAVNNAPAIASITPDGTLTEVPIPGAISNGVVVETPQEIATGSDGNLWFTETTDKIGRITSSGQITEYPIP